MDPVEGVQFRVSGNGLRDAEVFLFRSRVGRVLHQGSAWNVTHVHQLVVVRTEDETFLTWDRIGECVVGSFLFLWWLFNSGFLRLRHPVGSFLLLFLGAICHRLALVFDLLLLVARDRRVGSWHLPCSRAGSGRDRIAGSESDASDERQT